MNRRRIIRWLISGVVGLTAFATARIVLPCQPRVTIPLEGMLLEQAFSPDGALLVTATLDGHHHHLSVWDCTTGRLRTDLKQEVTSICSIALSPDARRVAALTLQGDCIVWDVATGLELSSNVLEGFSDYAELVTFGGDGRLFAVCLTGPRGEPLAVAPFGRGIGLTVWNGTSGRKLVTHETRGSVAFKDGAIVGIGHSRGLDIYDVVAGRRLATVGEEFWGSNPDYRRGISYARSAGILAVADLDRQCLTMVNVISGRSQATQVGDDLDYAPICLSPDGRRAAIGGLPMWGGHPLVPLIVRDWLPDSVADRITEYDRETGVVVYDTSNGKAKARLPGCFFPIFSADGASLVVVSEDPSSQVRVYDLPFRGPTTTSVLFAFGCGGAALLTTLRLVRRRSAA
jgi:hypothetical protein